MLPIHILERVHRCGGENRTTWSDLRDFKWDLNTGNQNETVLAVRSELVVEERARDQLGDHKALSLGLEFFIFTEEHIWLLLLTLGL